jgi:hypothetical protein
MMQILLQRIDAPLSFVGISLAYVCKLKINFSLSCNVSGAEEEGAEFR